MKKEEISWEIASGLLAVLFAIGLVGYMLAGVSSRFMKDDYCYAVVLDRRPFLEGQLYSYLNAIDFSGNRFSLTLGMGLSELAGRWTVSALPAFMITLGVAGLYLSIRRLNSLLNGSFNRLETFLAAEAIVLYTITQAPNWIQVIYWRPGMFPYFAPIALGSWLALLMLNSRPGKWSGLYLAGIFFLALLVGGFSEVGSAVETTALALAVAASAFSNDRKRWLAASLAAFGGALVALALLAFSPVSAMRLSHLYGTHADLTTAMLESFKSVIAFYIIIAYRSTLVYLSAFVFFCILSVVEHRDKPQSVSSLKSTLRQLMLLLAVAYVLTWAAMLPSFYAESGGPGQRVLVIPTFISILLAAGLGILAGRAILSWPAQPRQKWWGVAALLFGVLLVGGLWLGGLQKHFVVPDYAVLRSFISARRLQAISLLVTGLFVSLGIAWRFNGRSVAVFIILILYLCQPALIAAQIYTQLPALQERAALWDQREAQILALRAQGVTAITVRALDNLAGIQELSLKPGNWVNTCAAKYYKIKSIKVIQPVLNPPQP